MGAVAAADWVHRAVPSHRPMKKACSGVDVRWHTLGWDDPVILDETDFHLCPWVVDPGNLGDGSSADEHSVLQKGD